MKIKYSEIKNFNITEDVEEIEALQNSGTKIKVPEFDPLDFDSTLEETSITHGNGLCEMPSYCRAKLIEAGKYRKIIVSSNNSTGNGLQKIRTLSNNRYLNLETGEIKKRKRKEKRIETISNLNKSINEVRLLIYTNFIDVDGFFITLAYDSYMPDSDKAQKDFGKFMDKLRYYYKKRHDLTLCFLKIIEPKESGSWHFHILIKSDNGKPLNMTQELIRLMWQQNNVKVSRITNGEGLASYLGSGTCTYTDNDNFSISMLGNKKCTHSRRAFYKNGMRLYSKSQNLKVPTETIMSQTEAYKAVADCKKINENHTLVKKKSARGEYILNAVNYETYKKED